MIFVYKIITQPPGL